MYTNKTNKELLEILDQQDLLTFESQLSLRDELKKREIIANTAHLETSISKKLDEIKNLDYLKDFGFQVERLQEGILITRTIKAIVMDVFAVLIGLLVFLSGIYGVINLVMTFVNGDELDVFTLAFKFAMASLLFIGIKFFSGIKRLFDFAGFQLSNIDGMITLKKRFDVRLEKIQAKTSDLLLENEEEIMKLKLGAETIFTSNAENLIQTLTLQQLAKELKGE